MGLYRKQLPDRLLRLVSPEDLTRMGKVNLYDLPVIENDVVFTKMPNYCPRDECRHLCGNKRRLLNRKGFMVCPKCGDSYGNAPEKNLTCTGNQKPKAHGAKYSLPVVLAWFEECGLPAPVPEFRFSQERKWRFDFCWVAQMVALECQGGVFSGGAHVRGAALLREFEKLNAAATAGYRVLFVTPDQLCLTDTADMIRQALAI